VRAARLKAIKEYAGDPSCGPRPLNIVERAIDLFVAHLAAANPQNDVRTERLELRAEALTLGLKLNHLGDEIRRKDTSELVILDALTSGQGIARVGIRTGADVVNIQGRPYNLGQPYERWVSIDDWGIDPNARRADEIMCEWERVRVPRYVAEDSGIYDKKVLDKLSKLTSGDGERAEELSKDELVDDCYDLLEFYDVAIYDEDVIHMVTLPCKMPGTDVKFLRSNVWEGPETGPFHRLIPWPQLDSPFGKSLAEKLRQNNEDLNAVAHKAVDQMKRAKRVVVGQKNHADDLDTVKESKDADYLALDNPESVKTIEQGGLVSEIFNVIGMLQAYGNLQVVNMDLLAGLSDSETATEDSGNRAAALLIVGKLQRKHVDFENGVTKHLAWYEIYNPLANSVMSHRLPGGELIEVAYTAEQREGDFLDYSFKIHYTSMNPQDPNVRVRRLVETVMLLGKLAPGSVDPAAAARLIGREAGIEELDEVILDPAFQAIRQAQYAGVPQLSQGQPAGQSAQAPQKFQIGQSTSPPRGIDQVRSASSYRVPA
jgi:hypothetical protein